MKIKEDSWHFKYVSQRWLKRPPSLCWYFWKVVISIIIIIGAGIAILCASIGAFFILFGSMFGWRDTYFVPPEVSIVLLAGIGVMVLRGYRLYLYDTGQLERPIVKPQPHKEPGLVSQYLHAKHRKICPLLEYERRQGQN